MKKITFHSRCEWIDQSYIYKFERPSHKRPTQKNIRHWANIIYFLIKPYKKSMQMNFFYKYIYWPKEKCIATTMKLSLYESLELRGKWAAKIYIHRLNIWQINQSLKWNNHWLFSYYMNKGWIYIWICLILQHIRKGNFHFFP